MINEGSEIPPGSFRLSSEEPPKPEANPRPDAEPRPDLVAKYSLFKEKIKPKAEIVYHPCGADDVSPSIPFPIAELFMLILIRNRLRL